MKQKIVAVLMTVLLAAMLFPLQVGAEDWVEISTPEEFLLIQEHPDGNYRLTDDLDMGDISYLPFAFYGHFDGEGHSIYNLTVTQTGTEVEVTHDGNRKPYDTVFAGLFSDAKHATIENLSIVDAFMNIASEEHCFLGGIAGYIEESSIRNCSVSGRLWMEGKNVMVGVGGIAGFGSGYIQNCNADVELVFTDHNQTGIKCEEFMGGILSCGIAQIEDCKVRIDGYDSCHGYVHNGGLVGMYYHCLLGHRGEYSVIGSEISGKITFFEDNRDRRAYCKAEIGEPLTEPRVTENTDLGFERNEVRDFETELKPEACASPKYEDEVVPNTCTEWGYTMHTCRGCGCQWRDSYVRNAHGEAETRIEREPTYDKAGVSKTYCKDCGTVLSEEELPMLVRTDSCEISEKEVFLHYQDEKQLTVTLLPENAAEKGVCFESSDESTVKVDQNGLLYALKPGSAVITCTAEDGYSKSQCIVYVKYSVTQWLIRIFLFGWIWA